MGNEVSTADGNSRPRRGLSQARWRGIPTADPKTGDTPVNCGFTKFNFLENSVSSFP